MFTTCNKAQTEESVLVDKVISIVSDRITNILSTTANTDNKEDISIVLLNRELKECISTIQTLNELRFSGYCDKFLYATQHEELYSEIVNDLMSKKNDK